MILLFVVLPQSLLSCHKVDNCNLIEPYILFVLNRSQHSLQSSSSLNLTSVVLEANTPLTHTLFPLVATCPTNYSITTRLKYDLI